MYRIILLALALLSGVWLDGGNGLDPDGASADSDGGAGLDPNG